MLKDITLGQYYSTDSLMHRLDPRLKIRATIAYIILLLLDRNVALFGMLTVIFVFSCFNGNLLYSLSPLQAVFQLSSTKLIRNFDAIFDYMLFFSYFASAAVLMTAYKVTKKEFTYFNNADLLLVIPLFFMVLCTENMLFIIESALAAVVFLGMDRKGKT